MRSEKELETVLTKIENLCFEVAMHASDRKALIKEWKKCREELLRLYREES